jgi:hypothetical protein
MPGRQLPLIAFTMPVRVLESRPRRVHLLAMPTLTRRSFLVSAAATVAVARLHAQSPEAAHASLALPAQAAGPQMPAGFVGLSYEIQQLKDPSFFAPSNTGLVQQFRALSPHGVLRMGGNTSEFGWWKPTLDSPEPEHPQTRVVPGEPQPIYYPVTAEAVNNLEAFLRATNWNCIYGLNLGTGTPERAAQEAAYVAKTLGSRLEYFQVGNEVDLFTSHLRDPKTWNPHTYLDQWLKFARAVTAAVPDAKFGMPDVASRLDWLTEIAELWPAVQNPPRVVRLSHHYYFGGPATNPKVNVPNLLSPHSVATVQDMADIAKAAAGKMGVPLRMTEGNTCYRGGKPGVSDVFAAALWAADYALLLATNGYTGVNLHGGSGPSVANSVGGSLPGDQLLSEQGETPEQIASHPHPFYTPIASFGSEYVLEPVAYGLKFAGAMIGGTFFKTDLSGRLLAAGVDATAYAAKMPNGELKVAILNKDANRDLTVDLDCGSQQSGTVATVTLHAPALDSRKAQITSASSSTKLTGGRCSVTVPHATGMCLTVRA